jgi:adenylate cyclase
MSEPEKALDLLESCQPRLHLESVIWMQQDTDLMALREHPRFKALMARGEARLAAARAEQAAKAL